MEGRPPYGVRALDGAGGSPRRTCRRASAFDPRSPWPRSASRSSEVRRLS